MFDNSRILITGATGSWGTTLCRMLLDSYNVKEIVCFSRGELGQVVMSRNFTSPKVRFVIGDVRDQDAVLKASKNVDYIFHLAALKHVPICEDNPQEAIKTNIEGTINIINAAITNKVKKVIDVSTDKAVEPINLYGMTKAVGEKLIIQANTLSDITKFVCIRGGNVMGSNGSVIPLFINQIKNGGPITLTDARMTRFFLTLEEAIKLLFKASEDSIGGETFVMNMPSCFVLDLAEVLMEGYGKVDIVETGMRPGEKLDEMLISEHDAPLSYEYDNDYWLTLPMNPSEELLRKYKLFKKLQHSSFSSKTSIMDKKQIKSMLQKGYFL